MNVTTTSQYWQGSSFAAAGSEMPQELRWADVLSGFIAAPAMCTGTARADLPASMASTAPVAIGSPVEFAVRPAFAAGARRARVGFVAQLGTTKHASTSIKANVTSKVPHRPPDGV